MPGHDAGRPGGPSARADAARSPDGAHLTQPAHVDRVWIAGVPCDRLDTGGAVATIAHCIETGERCRVLVTNANKAWLARRDPRLRSILDNAELAVPEWAMVWAAQKLRIEGVHHIGGITLMTRLLEEAENKGWSVYFLGARARVIAQLTRRMRAERPRLRIVGAHHGYLDRQTHRAVVSDLARTRPNLLFVAMGSPLQEYFIDETWTEAGACVTLGVGGSFDVIAGFKKDAPKWARGRGLEWAYRLAQDPRRLWRRYLVTNSWFVGRITRDRFRRRR